MPRPAERHPNVLFVHPEVEHPHPNEPAVGLLADGRPARRLEVVRVHLLITHEEQVTEVVAVPFVELVEMHRWSLPRVARIPLGRPVACRERYTGPG